MFPTSFIYTHSSTSWNTCSMQYWEFLAEHKGKKISVPVDFKNVHLKILWHLLYMYRNKYFKSNLLLYSILDEVKILTALIVYWYTCNLLET